MALCRSILCAAFCLGAHAGAASADPDAPWRDRPTATPGDDGDRHAAPPARARPVEGGAAVDPEDVALAGPRVVLAIPRLILKIALTPIHALAYVAGRYRIPERAVDLLYSDERDAAILPYVMILGGQGLTFGATAFHAGLGSRGERLSGSAAFGGVYQQAYRLSVSAPSVGGTPLALEASTAFDVEPSQGFWGLGSAPRDDTLRPARALGPREAAVETSFSQRRFFTNLRAGWSFSRQVRLGVIGVLAHYDFEESQSDDEPSIERVYDVGRLVGFEEGFTLAEPLLDFVIDTRAPRGRPASGLRFDTFAGGPPPQQGYGFFHAGAALTGYLDLYGGDRILVLHAAHEMVFGADSAIPFAALPRLGGPRRLRGYERNRLRDKRTFLAVAEYEYPIHEYVDGALFVEMGSVGRDHEELIDPRHYRFSVGGSLLFRSRDTRLFSLQLGYGEGLQFFLTTDPFLTFSDKGEAP